jgi:3-hydroxyisobutyrate dehydrogenase-like beta-hydroxyacid dehydrogenase
LVCAELKMARMSNDFTPATVVGLGAMGHALAVQLIAAGHPTTVWNRTPGKAVALIARGATEAPPSTQPTWPAPG